MSFIAPAEHDEVACSLAVLLLADSGVKVDATMISKVLKATNNTVEPYWPTLYAKYLGSKDIAEILFKPSCGGAAAPAAAGAAAATDAPAEEKKEEKEEEEEEEVDMSGGGLFGGDEEEDW